jgi:hypothetical protein
MVGTQPNKSVGPFSWRAPIMVDGHRMPTIIPARDFHVSRQQFSEICFCYIGYFCYIDRNRLMD